MRENILIDRWGRVGLLDGVKDKSALAVLLQAQFEFNDDKSVFFSMCKRVSIPLLRRIVERLQEKIPVQTSLKKLPNYIHYTITPFAAIPRAQHEIDRECRWAELITEEIIPNLIRDFPNGIKLNHIEFIDDSLFINYETIGEN